MFTCDISVIWGVVFGLIRWLVICVTVSAALPLSDPSDDVEIVEISASGNFSFQNFPWC